MENTNLRRKETKRQNESLELKFLQQKGLYQK